MSLLKVYKQHFQVMRLSTEEILLRSFLQQLKITARADWLVAIVYKSTDNKNDVGCNAWAFSTENKANSARTFSMLL